MDLWSIAVSEIGIDPEEAWRLDLIEFNACYKRYSDKKVREFDEMSALLRVQTFYLFNVHLEQKHRVQSPNDLWFVNGDKKKVRKIDLDERANLIAEQFGTVIHGK